MLNYEYDSLYCFLNSYLIFILVPTIDFNNNYYTFDIKGVCLSLTHTRYNYKFMHKHCPSLEHRQDHHHTR